MMHVQENLATEVSDQMTCRPNKGCVHSSRAHTSFRHEPHPVRRNLECNPAGGEDRLPEGCGAPVGQACTCPRCLRCQLSGRAARIERRRDDRPRQLHGRRLPLLLRGAAETRGLRVRTACRRRRPPLRAADAPSARAGRRRLCNTGLIKQRCKGRYPHPACDAHTLLVMHADGPHGETQAALSLRDFAKLAVKGELTPRTVVWAFVSGRARPFPVP